MWWDTFELALTDTLRRKQFAWRRAFDSIVVEHTDGCDVLVVSPGHFTEQQDVSAETAANEWLARFMQIDVARTRVLNALRHLANEHQAKITAYGASRWQLDLPRGGGSSVNVGASLTRLIGSHDIVTAFCEMMDETIWRPFSEIEAQRLLNLDVPLPPQKVEPLALEDALPRARVPQVELMAQPPVPSKFRLISFDAIDLDEANRRTDEWLAAIRADLKGCSWSDRLWYDRHRDTWVDEAWWLQRAQQAWESGKVRTVLGAALILLANGDMRPKAEILAHAKEVGYYDQERFSSDLAWLLADEMPWPVGDDNDEPAYPTVLGPVPPRQAHDYATTVTQWLHSSDSYGIQMAFAAVAKFDRASAYAWLMEDQIESVHRTCLDWAAGDDSRFIASENLPLQVAAVFGWGDVVDLLATNDTWPAPRFESELCRWHVGEVAQQLSLIKPGKYTARWAAQILLADKIKVAPRQINHEPHYEYKPMQHRRAAIAWHRCRETGFAD